MDRLKYLIDYGTTVLLVLLRRLTFLSVERRHRDAIQLLAIMPAGQDD
jgi:hypothetical protein